MSHRRPIAPVGFRALLLLVLGLLLIGTALADYAPVTDPDVPDHPGPAGLR